MAQQSIADVSDQNNFPFQNIFNNEFEALRATACKNRESQVK
jgi:hypothetical protein